MLNLYWKSHDQTRSLIEHPFSTEMEFEKYIFENQDILGDIYIVYRQVRTGSKQGIPDMLGVDQDGRICIVEIKNQQAGEDILPQVLQYAIWAETNPDSIKAIWLESKRKPEDIQLDWDNLDIRVVLIAPAFKSTVSKMAGKIGYPIELFQIRRYHFETEEFILVEQIKEPFKPKVVATTATDTWDWAYYESEHGSDATAQFRKAVDAVQELVTRRGWEIQYNLNKSYTGFKLGNKLVFTVGWSGTYTWKIYFKLPKAAAQAFRGQYWEYQGYDETFKQAVFKPLQPDKPDIQELEPLFETAYQTISGRKK